MPPAAPVRSISSNNAHPPNVGTGTFTIGAASGVKFAVTVQGAVIAPVTNGLVVVVGPPHPLILVSVKPALAVAVQVDVLPKLTGFGAQFTVPPLAETASVVMGKLLGLNVAITVQSATTALVVNVLPTSVPLQVPPTDAE